MAKALIIGISGQDGAYLAKFLLDKGYDVVGSTRNIKTVDLFRLSFLQVRARVKVVGNSLDSEEEVIRLLKEASPDEVYNLAAQSSVGYSFKNPIGALKSNLLNVGYFLSAISKVNKEIKFYQASSSEMFGEIGQANLPVKEQLLFQPVSPYAISKASAHWLTINYREAFGLKACCGILFNHESCLRGEKYVIKKIIRSAIQIKQGKIDSVSLGNLSVRRDWGYAPKYVEAMWLMLQQDTLREYLICSGTVISLETFAMKVFDKLGVDAEKAVRIDRSLMRSLDLEEIYGDNSKAKNELGWSYDYTPDDLIETLIEDEKRIMKWENGQAS